MLYREDCPVDFLRKSRFQWDVMRDPALPVATARAVLDAKPSAWEIRVLSGRKDLTSKELQLAAVRGRARARWQGKSGGDYAALRCLPAGWLELTANGVDDEIVGILRNPNCPEAVVRRYVTCGSARVRLQALLATHRRDPGHRVVAGPCGSRPPHDRLRELPAPGPRAGGRQPHPRRPMNA